MEIKITTNGFSQNTEVLINGEKIENPAFFGISVKYPGKVKLTCHEKISIGNGNVRERPKLSLWGANIQDYDKATLPTGGDGK